MCAPSRVGWILRGVTLLLAVADWAACARPLGIPEDAGSGVPVSRDPCDDLGGLDPEAPWPMTGRCPSQASFLAVTGPASPQVLWTVDVWGAGTPQAVVDASDMLYSWIHDGEIGPAVHAIDRDGDVRWKTRLEDWESPPPNVFALTQLALGRDGSIYVTNGTKIAALDRSGALRFREDLPTDIVSGLWTEPSCPVISADGSIEIGNVAGFASFDPTGALRWFAVATSSSHALLDREGRVITAQESWGQGGGVDYEIVSFDGQGVREVRARSDRTIGCLMIDPTGGFLVTTALDLNLRLQAYSPQGKLRWSREISGASWTTALAIDDQQRIRLGHGGATAENPATLSLIHSDGSLGWETAIPGAGFHQQIIVDQQGTTYLAGHFEETGPAWLWAIDAEGTVQWSLPLLDTWAHLVAMGRTGRLYVKTTMGVKAVGDAGQ